MVYVFKEYTALIFRVTELVWVDAEVIKGKISVGYIGLYEVVIVIGQSASNRPV